MRPAMMSNNKGFCLSRISIGYSFQKCLAIVPPILHDRTRNQLPFAFNYFWMAWWVFVQIGISPKQSNKWKQNFFPTLFMILNNRGLPQSTWKYELKWDPLLQTDLAVCSMPIKIYCFSRVLVTVHLAHIFTQWSKPALILLILFPTN